MSLLFTILIFITSILLILVVLVQNPKGGGLSSAFGGGSQQMLGGVKKTTDFLDRSTWTLSIILLALVLASNLFLGNVTAASEVQDDSAITEQIEGFSVPPAQTVVPAASSEGASEGLPETVEEEE
jgi:preprotein translocase subunit SecG